MATPRFYSLIVSLVLLLATGIAVSAQDATTDARAATGGAQTLEDILARQDKLKVDDTFRKTAIGDPNSAAAIADQLGTLGGISDAEGWRGLRYGLADVTASYDTPTSHVVIQDGGMWWLQVRAGPLKNYGGYTLLAVLALLAVFYLIRGRIRIEAGRSGEKVRRFKLFSVCCHWLMAASFILLGLTGIINLFGRFGLIPVLGKDAFAAVAEVSIFIHNWVSWGFMTGLVLIFLIWVRDNIPNRRDLTWLAMGGGILSEGKHPPAKKFNAGQKILFWLVVILGGSISVSGLSLLFPYQLPLFAGTFEILNSLGIPQLLGIGPLETQLAPHEEMQFAQLWHAIVGFAMIAIILGHIYIGTVGMEGGIDAMVSGKVDKNWAKQHHNLWVEEMEQAEKSAPDQTDATPAE